MSDVTMFFLVYDVHILLVLLLCAGVILSLPWSKEAVWLVTILYCVRAVYSLLLLPFVPFFKTRFMVISSLIVLISAGSIPRRLRRKGF